MGPTPVGVNGDLSRDGRAVAVARALSPLKGRAGLSGEGANLLGGRGCHKGSEGGELGVHGEDLAKPGWMRGRCRAD